MQTVQPERLLANLLKIPGECEWIEFKENNDSPEMIGETVSALSNGARLKGEPYGYLVWGIRDGTHDVDGTTFRPENARKGNEALEHWLVRSLTPRMDLRFMPFNSAGLPMVILEIPAALHMPVQFAGQEYIRIGSVKKPLKEYPEKERELWQTINIKSFEKASPGLDLRRTMF